MNRNLSPFGEGRGPSPEQTWIPSTQGFFVPSLVESGTVVLEKKIFKYFDYNLTFLLLSSLVKGHGPSFEQTWIPSTQGCFVPSLVEIVQGFWRRSWNVKSLQTNRLTDRRHNRRSEKLIWAFGSGELKRTDKGSMYQGC